MLTLLKLAVLGTLFASAAFAADAAPISGSCNIQASSQCMDYTGSAWVRMGKMSCGGISGVYSTSPCPTAHVMGSCAGGGGTPQMAMIVRFYSAGGTPYSQASALSYCTKSVGHPIH